MYVGDQWELIGTTTIDLSNYLQKSDISVTQALTTGIPAATITVGDITTTIYSNDTSVQSDWTQTTDTELDFIKNKPAIWDSEDYTVPSGQTYGDSTTKAIGAVALNLKTNSAKGNYSVSEGYQPTGTRKVTINNVSTTLPYGASGESSHAEGYYTIASGRYSHTEGQNTVAHGSHSHAEGFYAIASGNYSHAEGEGSVASGDCSHAEGNSSTASDASSHAEGNSTVASGVSSHAEGYGSKASSYYSHAEGYQTIAQRKSQHVFGEYNVSDTTGSASTRGTYVEIVGNGTSSSARSNARTLDWSGNEWLAGKVTVANLTPTADGDLTTKQYVDNAVTGITPSVISATSTLSEGTEIGSIDINGTTTVFYAPEDTKVKQNDITDGSITTGMYPFLLSDTTRETTTTITSEAYKTGKLGYNASIGTFIVSGNGSNNNGGFYINDYENRQNYVGFIIETSGTTTTNGVALANIGNSNAIGTDGNAEGRLVIFGAGKNGNIVKALDNGNDKIKHTNYLPMTDGVLAAGVTTGVGSSTVPVYMASTGELLACSLPTPTTYTMSITGPTINLLADGVAASTITLPIWDGTLD